MQPYWGMFSIFHRRRGDIRNRPQADEKGHYSLFFYTFSFAIDPECSLHMKNNYGFHVNSFYNSKSWGHSLVPILIGAMTWCIVLNDTYRMPGRQRQFDDNMCRIGICGRGPWNIVVSSAFDVAAWHDHPLQHIVFYFVSAASSTSASSFFSSCSFMILVI